jgi:hypothetical protein
MKLIDLTGRKFGRWTVLGRANHNDAHNKPLWVCRCDCGVERLVTGGNLRSGISQSCGCLKSERTRAVHFKHGHSRAQNGKRPRVYTTWLGMLQRCLNPRNPGFHNYGGRGIIVCKRWHKFENFYADMGDPPDGLTLDRKDNDKGYSPQNCKWSTRLEQVHNRRPPKRKARRSTLAEIEKYAATLARAKHARASGTHQRADPGPARDVAVPRGRSC